MDELKKNFHNHLQEEHRRLNEAQAIGLIGSFEWNLGDEVVNWSDQMYRINGMEPQSSRITIERTNRLIHPDDFPTVHQLKETSFITPGHYELTHRIVLDNGTVKWVVHRFESIADETGNIVRVHGTLQDVTTLKKSEEELLRIKDELARQATDRYRLLFNAIDEGFCIFELMYDEAGKAVDWKYIEANPAFERQTGYMAPIGKTISYFQPDLERSWFETFAEVARTGNAIRFVQHTEAMGIWYDVYAMSVGEAGGNRVSLLFNDITERKRSEAALRDSEEVFRSYVTASSDIVYKMSADWKTMYNLQGKDFLTSTQNASTFWLESYIPEHEQERVWKAIGEAIGNKSLFELEHQVFDVAGNLSWTYSRAVPRLDEKGAIIEWIGAASDITDRKRRERQQNYLLKLSDTLRPLSDAAQIEEAAIRLLGEALKTNRVFYASIEADGDTGVIRTDFVDGIRSGVGRYSLSAFAPQFVPEWREGRVTISNDVNTDPRFTEENRAAYASVSARSAIGVPLLKEGRFVALMAVNHASPRTWTDEEIALIKETSERTWDAAERARAEEALRQSENRLQRMVNMPQVGVLTFDHSGKMMNVNDAFLEMVGYTREEFAAQPRTWKDFTPAEHTEKSHEIMQQIRSTGRGGPYEKEYFRKDGSRIWLMFVAADLGDSTIGEYAIDISARKAGEEMLARFNEQLEYQVKERTEELQKNLTLLKQAEDLALVGSWDYDLITAQFNWSEGMYRMFEIKPGTPLNPEIYFQLAIAKDKPLAAEVVNKIKTASGPIDETICIKIGDAVRIIKVRGNAMMDEQGKPVKVVGVDMDITLSRQAEETLEQQAHFIESTNAALPDILFVMNLDTKILAYINHSFEEKMGYTEEQRQRIQAPLFDIMYEEDLPLMREHLKNMKTAADDEIREIEYRLVAPDGSLRWFNDRDAVFKRDKSGMPVEKIGIAQEITVRKKAEQVLKETNTSLRYANENLQQFASIASHDLQEPLRKLKLFASVLRRYDERLPNEGKELVQKISLTAERMSQLIREVLQYSRIAYGAKEFVRTNLDEVLQNVLGDLELLIKDSGATVEQTQPLPEIEAIPPQVNQLFYNLLTNALKFRKEGVQPFIRISVGSVPPHKAEIFPELKSGSSHIEIVFADNGVGFNPAYAEQIFQIFERLYSVEEFEGTGVGLALCKKIVENHDGHIYAVSAEEEGASFHVLLPTSQTTGSNKAKKGP